MYSNRYIELILYKTYADLRSEAARTYISFLWWILDPLLYMAVFYVVFAILLNRGTANFVMFLLIGLTFWKWFSSSILHAVNSISMHRGLIQQIYLPKLLFPIITVLTDLVKFSIILIMLIVFVLAQGNEPGFAWISLPVLVICQLLLIIGLACLVAAITPLFPDIRILTESALMLLMFLSGVFYESALIPEQYQGIYFLNPMAIMLDAFRLVLLHNQMPDWWRIGYVALIGIIALVLALTMLIRMDRVYPRMALA